MGCDLRIGKDICYEYIGQIAIAYLQSRYSNEHPAIPTILHGCSFQGFYGLCLVEYFR